MKTLKIGDLVYLKDVGYPYTRTDDGGESFEGASGTVISLNAGYSKDMVDVQFLFPIKTTGGDGSMSSCLFFPSSVIKENRPWLKKHLKKVFTLREELLKLSEKIKEELE